ncbi:MAG: sulfotransferase [Planctomycetota bacterium]
MTPPTPTRPGLSPPVIIVGMHRSGTTLVTQLLQHAGLHPGADLEKNAESRFFLNCNRWLLQQAGGRWDHPEPIQAVLDHSPLTDAFAASLQTLLNSPRARRFRFPDASQPWGWKDPRNTWTLPLWLRLFPDARVVHVTRHGVDVARSLVTRNQRILDDKLPLQSSDVIRFTGGKKRIAKIRDGLSPACATLGGAFDLWHRYLQAAETHLAEAPLQHSLRYEDLLTEPTTVLTQLLEFCQLTADPDAVLQREQLNATRCYAYRHDPDAARFAQDHAPTLAAFGYDA